MTVSITAAAIELAPNSPIPHLGAQVRMDGGVYFYIQPETAEQWIGVLKQIADEQ